MKIRTVTALIFALFCFVPQALLGTTITSASYNMDTNILTLVFDDSIYTTEILLGKLSFDDDNGGPKADVTFSGGTILTTDILAKTIEISLVYGGIIDRIDAEDKDFWGNDVSLVNAVESMDSLLLRLIVEEGAFLDKSADPVGVVPAATADVEVSAPLGTEGYPIVTEATYDANVNVLTLVFDTPVQFDQIAEDGTFAGGPGDKILNAGEDRNGNGVLDMEPDIDIFKVGFTDGLGNNMNLEGLDKIIQTTDDDTISIILTKMDSKKLETTLQLSSLAMKLSAGAFVDTLYNPSASSTIAATVVEDSIPLVADSASYNVSDNELLIYFNSKQEIRRKISVDPAPVYSKFSFSVRGSSINLSGIDGNPLIKDNIAFQAKELLLFDQKALEIMIDGMGEDDTLFMSVDEYAIYDENGNGNLQVSNVPVTITSSTTANKQSPQITPDGLSYDAQTDILTLQWELNVGYFNEIVIPKQADVTDYSLLDGFALYDQQNDSSLIFSLGKVYYTTSKKVTFIELHEEDAIKIESYSNKDGLILTIDTFTFYSAKPYNNGVKALKLDQFWIEDPTFSDTTGQDDLSSGGTFTGIETTHYRVEIDRVGEPDTYKWSNDGGTTFVATGIEITVTPDTLENGVTITFGDTTGHTIGSYWDFSALPYFVKYQVDTTAPALNSVLYNTSDSTLMVTLDEPVVVASLDLGKFSLGGVQIDGNLKAEGNGQYSSSFTVGVSSSVHSSITSLDDSVKISPEFTIDPAAFVNLDGAVSSADTVNAGYGRYFWVKSFEAFPDEPWASSFASLRSVGDYCEIYVNNSVWGSKVDSSTVEMLREAFEELTPTDSLSGIYQQVRTFAGNEKDTDSNGKVTILLTDILDEYGLGRNDTNDKLFTHGYVSMSDTSAASDYSNLGDIIYLDANPQTFGSSDAFRNSFINALAHEFHKMVSFHNHLDQEYWVMDGVSFILQEKIVGDVKFFGASTDPKATSGNELTFISGSLKTRNDYWNTYLFLTYLSEKYSLDGTGWDIISEVTNSDSVGTKAIDDALISLGFSETSTDVFINYGTACFLDLVHQDIAYDSLYSFDVVDLQGPPSGKNATKINWDVAEGKGAPYAIKNIFPWSYNYYAMRGYFIDIEGNIVIVSPDLDSTDTIVFNGYDGIKFRAKKIVLRNSFLDNMSPDFEVADFSIDSVTAQGELPITTDSHFAFRDTTGGLDQGVQIIVLVVAKTDYAQPPATYDFVISNILTKPDFSDFYAFQNPGIQNYLDLYLVSQRRIYSETGVEGPVIKIVFEEDTSMVTLAELYSYLDDLVIYDEKWLLSEEGTYSFIFQGRDQSGNELEGDTIEVVVDYYVSSSSKTLVSKSGVASFILPSGSLPKAGFVASIELESGSMNIRNRFDLNSVPGVKPVTPIFSFGSQDQELNRLATLTLSIPDGINPEEVGVYRFHKGKWQHIRGTIGGSSISAHTRFSGYFVLMRGEHPPAVEDESPLPMTYSLSQNYPNPFNPATSIRFALPAPSHVSLKIYDILGREVVTIVDGYREAGYHVSTWNGRDRFGVPVASGLYIYRIETKNLFPSSVTSDGKIFQSLKKMVLVK